ncbi:MAG TPA: asparagine--tRNA ligase [Thermoanaerobaculia bacterium]|nr:asparagine--tRNA ligase [Thermoanaerobaculia bacterium]HUM31139.1 asparagine--tRNA ligase [Thermoanaerobaculia bacterium]HXK69495.1 asparagine--tRNA ligase [Thermoanaerobaculia bacterium]
MTQTSSIKDLARYIGQIVSINGWVYHLRSSGKIRFIVVRDGSGYVQVVAGKNDVTEEVWDLMGRLTYESSITIEGLVREDQRSPGGVELTLKDMNVHQIADEYPIQPKEHGIEFLSDNRHLWLRSKQQVAILKVRNEICQSIRDFFYERDFVLIDSPILTPTSCEGTSTLFSVDYFGEPAYLTQSGQLYVEPACMAHGKVYCFGPTFRAEKSKTRRHLTEFWMVEPEVAYADLDAIMELAESFLSYLIDRVLDRSAEQLKILERDVAKLEQITRPFKRITYDQAAKILTTPEAIQRAQEQGAPPFIPGNDFGGLDETLLTEQETSPLMVTHFPASIKAFYMEPDPVDSSKAKCVDVLAPEGYGEIIGGSERIHDHDLLLKRIRDHGLPVEPFQWYLDIRKYGSVVHSGFGMGIERAVAWLCGLPHIRETIPYPRMLNRLNP